jgi:hypothetical protein
MDTCMYGSLAPAHFLAVGVRYINCVCDYALLFEDPSVENRRPIHLTALPPPLPCASCAILLLDYLLHPLCDTTPPR